MDEKGSQNYIKLDRELLTHKLLKKPLLLQLFIYCLLKANWTPTKEDGIDIPRGSFLTTRAEIGADLKCSYKSVRMRLDEIGYSVTRANHRADFGADFGADSLERKKVGNKLMITVVHYDKWQGVLEEKGRDRGRPWGRPKGGKNATLPIKEKEKKEGREEENTLPTLDDVKNFAVEINSKTNPEKFYYHYVAHGWPKNWMAKFQEWTAKDGKNEQQEDGESEKWES